jgi:hypothetical protein
MSASSINKYTPILLALALFLPACQVNVGTVEAHLVYTSNVDQNPLDRDIVRTLRVRIEGDGMDSQETEFSLISGDGKALTDVPLGKNRVLTVEALDTAGNVRSRGTSTPFRTKSGKTKVYVYFSLVEKFSAPPAVFMDDEWNDTYRTDMTSPRVFHTATLLPDGTVLVAGGAPAPNPGDFMGRVENADPTIMRFQITPGAFLQEKETIDCESGKLCMHKQGGRAHHTANLLPGGTHVVVAGGEPVNPNEGWPAEYYSIQTRSFESKIGMLNRTRHASADLTGSREGVVIAGGEGQLASELLDSIELFEAGDFEDLSPVALSVPRTSPVAVAYEDRVVVIGGWVAPDQASKAVDVIHFDREPPEVESFSMLYDRAGHTAVVTESGEVFVCGGIRYELGVPEMVESCELLDPEAKTSTGIPGVRRWGHTVTLLEDGRMLLAGGFSSVPPTLAENSAVLFDTPVGTGSRKTVPMVSKRAGHTSTLLSNGMVVLIGGVARMDTIEMPAQDYEIFNPRPR